jgi:hypothetical protein
MPTPYANLAIVPDPEDRVDSVVRSDSMEASVVDISSSLSPAEPRWRPSLVLLIAVALLGVLLWNSHSSLEAKIEADKVALESLNRQLVDSRAEVNDLRAVLKQQTREVDVMKLGEVYRTPGVIALDRSGAQLLGRGFAVTALALEPVLDGHLLEGRLINLQAVKHQDLVFSVTVGDSTAEFSIPELEPGENAPFALYFAQMGADSPRLARFDYRESTIWHRAGD